MVGYIPKKLKDAEFKRIKNLTKEKHRDLYLWMFKRKGSAIFVGLPGRGKTYAAIAIANSLYNFFWIGRKCFSQSHPEFSFRFVNISELNQEWLSNTAQPKDNYDLLNELKDYPLLILDDIGVKKPSDAFLDYLFCLINHRANDDDYMTIFTTNNSAEELDALFTSRIMSRLANSHKVIFEGPDLRIKEKEMLQNEEAFERKIRNLYEKEMQSHVGEK